MVFCSVFIYDLYLVLVELLGMPEKHLCVYDLLQDCKV